MATIEEPAASTWRSCEAFVFRAVEEVGATLNAALVVMGDKLGLYRAMAGAGAADAGRARRRTGVAERYVREWLNAQAAGGYVEYDPADGRYTLPPEQTIALTDDAEPRVPAGLLPDRRRRGARLAADHRGGAERRRRRLARAQPRRVRGLRAVLPPGLQREPDRGVAAGARRRRREARARREGRRHRLRPRLVDDPDGAGVPELDVRRLRLPRGLDRHGARAGGRGRRRRSRDVRGRSAASHPGARLRPRDDVRLPARHGRPGRRARHVTSRCSDRTARG